MAQGSSGSSGEASAGHGEEEPAIGTVVLVAGQEVVDLAGAKNIDLGMLAVV